MILSSRIGKRNDIVNKGYVDDEINKNINKVELIDTKIVVSSFQNLTLDKVLMSILSMIGGIAQLKTKKKGIVGAINELYDREDEILSKINDYKAATDETNKELGIYIERHKEANNQLQRLR